MKSVEPTDKDKQDKEHASSLARIEREHAKEDSRAPSKANGVSFSLESLVRRDMQFSTLEVERVLGVHDMWVGRDPRCPSLISADLGGFAGNQGPNTRGRSEIPIEQFVAPKEKQRSKNRICTHTNEE